MTVKQLREEIKKRGVLFAYSNARKAELILALQRNDSGETTLDRIKRAYYSEDEIKEMKEQTRGDKNK